MTMVAVTAMPYAAARLLDDRNPITRPMQPAIKHQLTSGTYTWPLWVPEVWSIRSRGRKSSCAAWTVSEKAPEINACEAMTDAMVARTASGVMAQLGANR